MSCRKPYEFETAPADAPVMWTSMEDYKSLQSEDPAARADAAAEFHPKAFDFSDGVSRRSFMGLMGAAAAFGGLQGCRRPEEKILPYARSPEDVTVNVTSFYATVMDRRGEALGLLVESHEGRPTKIEGNPDHPSSRGSTDLLAQASVLDLYDPDRSRTPVSGSANKSWSDLDAALAAALAGQQASQGAGLRILAEPSLSPTFVRMRGAVIARFPQAKFHTWSAAGNSNARLGAKLAWGASVQPLVDFSRARVILSLDSDFLQTEPGAVRNSRSYAESRRPGEGMSRLYVVEPTFTTTGTNADHRLRLPGRDVGAYLGALAARLVSTHNLELGEVSGAVRAAQAPANVPAKWIEKVAADIIAHRGSSVLVVGSRQPPEVHALAHAINNALGVVGGLVKIVPTADAGEDDDHAQSVSTLASDIAQGRVQTLVILGGNPVHNAPADLELGAKVRSVQASFHLSTHRDETSAACTWHAPRAHWLESWGDARSLDGTVSVQQPLIDAMFQGRSDIELLAQIAGTTTPRGHDLVRATLRGETTALAAFDRQWRRSLNRGVFSSAPPPPPAPTLAGAAIAQRIAQRTAGNALSNTNLEVAFQLDAKVLDGRHANNAWLQELPDPITKITWDNAAYLSPRTAEALGVNSGDMVRLSKGNRAITVVAWVLPGQADFSVGLSLGWGREKAGNVGNGKGFDAYPLRAADALWFTDGVTLAKTGATYGLSQTQDHHRMEGRPIAVEATLARYQELPNFATLRSPSPRTLPLWREVSYPGYKWGMTIDLNLCTGCNACVIACQAENNIPVVGKAQVARGREMHWLRVDRYFVSPNANGSDSDAEATSDPAVSHQPLACVQCEEAPCENVCPVNATVHSPEGLNDMAYNRCIGTRYCANNCPYKVRRFNYLNFHNDGAYQPAFADTPETVRMQMNPNVTVRFRGVMEKCTYCVQRIQGRKIEAKRQNREVERNGVRLSPIVDGTLVTACQQACPADAISFGDLNDRGSRVARMQQEDRRYALLGNLGTQPRTIYLAKIRNPNTEMLG
jgi:molybdopterin-containing oxidoreductase family iron-sulfur binding subunit